jgi:hypothetical protein
MLKLEKRKLSTHFVITEMRKNGVEVSEKKADEVLDLIYFLAKLIVKENFKQ